MKKFLIFFFAAALSLFAFSCRDDNDNYYDDNDTYNVVYDLKNTAFEYDATNGYFINRQFNTALPEAYQVLIYRLNNSNGWELLPSMGVDAGGIERVKYTFDFTRNDFQIRALPVDGYSIPSNSVFVTSQTFRVVVIPGQFGRMNVDVSDYNAVVRFYNLNDTAPKKL